MVRRGLDDVGGEIIESGLDGSERRSGDELKRASRANREESRKPENEGYGTGKKGGGGRRSKGQKK